MSQKNDISSYFKGWKIALPLAISLGVAFLLLWRIDFSSEDIADIEWNSPRFIGFLAASVGMMLMRDVGYIARIRELSFRKLSWKKSFQLIMLWEFVSAISPTAVGGTAAAVVLVGQEKLNKGLTTAMVLLTSFLDELFYISMVPIVFLLSNPEDLFPKPTGEWAQSLGENSLQGLFWSGYTLLAVWTLFLAFAILFRPKLSAQIILQIFRLPFIRRWKHKAEQLGQDFQEASKAFKGQPFSFWWNVYGLTFLSWTARFIMVNFLILAFNEVDDHFTIYARQLIMWVILLMAFTPGGSGIAEALFPRFLSPYFPSRAIATIAGLLWRLISYVVYIIAGMAVLPFWLRRIAVERKAS
jgi:uncharacterized membrane protein YbhN (UPF0104 family)